MKLLYRTAEWHGFAKLRIHTDSTLEHLTALTKEFGLLMRQFRNLTCSQFQTMELPREVETRNRQQRVQAKQLSTGTRVPTASGSNSSSASTSRKPKTLNLLTPKFHFLGDYVRFIRMFGTTDVYSTQLVSKCYLYSGMCCS